MASRQCCRRPISSTQLWQQKSFLRSDARATISASALSSCACYYRVQPRPELSVWKTRYMLATKGFIVVLTSCQTKFAKAKNAWSPGTGPALLYVYWGPVLRIILTFSQRIRLLRFQKWQSRYRKALSSSGLNAGLRKHPQLEQHNSDYLAEIGDYVEQDEEIATIETDKVHL